MAEVKITLAGAGGMAFGPSMVNDAMRFEGVRGSTLMLHDINPERLELVERVANRMNKAMGEPIKVEADTDPARAYAGADFALISAELKRFECRKQDYEVPLKYGARHIMGENGGPGAVFHSLRSIKVALDICAEIEKYAPGAMAINLTNPMHRVTLAIERHTDLKYVGLCHEYLGGFLRLCAFLLTPPARLDAEASGMNHFTWFHGIRDRKTGEDLYPRLRRHVKRFPWLHQPLVRDSMERYGLYSTTEDSHVGEYLPHALDVRDLPKKPFHQVRAEEMRFRKRIMELYADGKLPLPIRILPKTGEEAFKIIEALAADKPTGIDAVNVLNRGYIANLPEEMIVEVPARADGDGLSPVKVPDAIEPLAEIMRLQFELQEMTVTAAREGDRDLAFEALRRDPTSPPDESSCRKIFDELYELQAELLPF